MSIHEIIHSDCGLKNEYHRSYGYDRNDSRKSLNFCRLHFYYFGDDASVCPIKIPRSLILELGQDSDYTSSFLSPGSNSHRIAGGSFERYCHASKIGNASKPAPITPLICGLQFRLFPHTSTCRRYMSVLGRCLDVIRS